MRGSGFVRALAPSLFLLNINDTGVSRKKKLIRVVLPLVAFKVRGDKKKTGQLKAMVQSFIHKKCQGLETGQWSFQICVKNQST